MPHKCAIADCMRKAGDAGVILFSLPKNPAIRDKWLQFANIDATENRSIRICNLHFKDSDIWKRYPRPLLRLNSVPCFKKSKNKLDNKESIMNVLSIPNMLESVRQEEESNMESSCSTHGMTCAPWTSITSRRRVSSSQCFSPKTTRLLRFKHITHNLRSKCNRLRQKQLKEKERNQVPSTKYNC
ncbi:52 kDa repressor of the inhibitor of the protein kinase-like [Hylaeus anthracinus]|uniref:52 kDa repressor of the inhibitor of the protein kinase-like n=1 Tax=Hylaeus anthracinus TaxID=313031 RepID=UPI0023B8D3CA|nr:52 kDa repressor of the inhibitor of the protein kinase-like [Hylaeus anthracinus]XP_053995317.1 52 kDa repressor of the inhibitor of the protein kinase-like [Hylaeus anthracinus]